MIHINLLPVREIKAEYGRRQELIFAGLILGLAVAAIGVLFLLQSNRLAKLEGQLRALHSEIEVLNTQARGVADLDRKIADLKGKLNIIEELRKKKTGPVRIMESLSVAMPDRLWLMEFKESDGNVTISGLAVDNQTVAEFLKALAAAPNFTNVELIETTPGDQGGGDGARQMRKFALKSGVNYQAAAADKSAATPKEEAKPQ